MAITIVSEPDSLSPASNPCTFVFESDNTTFPNFSFIVTLVVNGSDHSVHQIFLESGTRGKFNASSILRTLLKSNINENENLLNGNTNNWLSYSIKVQEKLGDPPKPIGLEYSSTTKTAFNGAFKYIDWTKTDFANYTIFSTSNPNTLFCTKYPRPTIFKGAEFVGLTEKKYLGFFLVGVSFEVTYKTLDVTGATLQSDTINSTPTEESERVIVLNVSPETIINDTALTATDFDNAYGFSIEVSNGFFSETEQYYYIIDRECQQFTHRRLHWMNKFGVWDSFTFKLRSRETTEVQSEEYQSSTGLWDENNDFIYPTYQGERKNAFVRSEEQLEINTDWIKEEVQNWLAESLLESPKVYLETEDGFELLIRQTKGYEKKKRFSDGLIQESYKFKRTYIYKSQLG